MITGVLSSIRRGCKCSGCYGLEMNHPSNPYLRQLYAHSNSYSNFQSRLTHPIESHKTTSEPRTRSALNPTSNHPPGAPNFFQPAATNIGPPATAATQPPPAGHFAPHSMAHCPPGQPRPPYSDYPSGGILSQSMPPPPPPIVSSQINFPPYGSVPPTPVQAPPPQTTRMRPPVSV